MKYKFLLLIFVIALISSLLISFTPTPIICNPEEGCDSVLSSSYAYTFGVKNSHYGVVIFTILSFVTLFHIKKPNKKTRHLIHLSMIIGSLIALYFMYLQYFVIKAYCKYCLVVDIILIIGLLITLFMWEK